MSSIRSISTVIFLIVNFFFLQAQIPEKPEDISPMLIGEILPNSSLMDQNGEIINFNDIIKEKPTVLVFYRGGWCPYCNLQLSGLVNSEEEIIKLGYQIVAISPDDYKNITPTINEGKVKYNVFSDPGGKFIQQIGLAFKASARTKEYISKKTIGETTNILPVPTVLIIDTKGEILFEYISPNYKKRITPELLIAVLKHVN
jgi:peroxiredoxin